MSFSLEAALRPASFASLIDDHQLGNLADWLASLGHPELAARLELASAEASGQSWWRALAASEFLRRSIAAEPATALAVMEGATPDTVSSLEAAPRDDAEALGIALRTHRRRVMLAIAWRDLADRSGLGETLEALSALADQCLGVALAAARLAMHRRHGALRDAEGAVIPLFVICMGKLGGRELNFSSDIDIIFAYPVDGESDGRRPLSASEYCLREARIVIDLIDSNTAAGRVFRVDTRLRPFGEAGPLAISFPALENYLQLHGRDWERYAFVKARFVAGEGTALAPALAFHETVIRPFVYRRYLDFGVLASLRDMKAMIAREVQRRDLVDHLKLGPGGIREVEFVAQSLQLIRGGQMSQLRTERLYAALDAIAAAGLLDATAVDNLRRAYDVLRVCENRLQALDDRQVHALPTDEAGRRLLTLAMGTADWEALRHDLDGHRRLVSEAFEAMLFQAEVGDDEGARWLDQSPEVLEAAVSDCGIADPEGVSAALTKLRKQIARTPIDTVSRERLERFISGVIKALAAHPEPAVALQRVLGVAAAVLRRSAYLALLNEQPAALERLVSLAGMSGFLADQLAAHPPLLDSLLDTRWSLAPLDRAALADDLAAVEADLGPADSEARVQALARFARAAWFRIAVADVSETLPLMKVSDRLTDVAEIVLERVLDIAWSDLVARHGRPPGCGEDRSRFAIVAYGKLGGWELGYGSDLDIVFLHDVGAGDTDGAQPIDATMFVMRLARRIVHLLSVQTGDGQLYEVDTRLRPSGRSGLLVSSLSAFRRYQAEDAWTWEHQALTRARAVAGDADVCKRFETLRTEVLCRDVRRATLAQDVVAMRKKMRDNLSEAKAGEFDIKQDRGGMGDLEFLVQYLVLRHACEVPAVADWSDNMRQLDSLANAGLLDADTASGLQQAYRAFRAVIHRRSLDRRGRVVNDQQLPDARACVRAAWDGVLGDVGPAS
ncbi:MAG: bifunctional [glutamate--ammonia ligase]-adenylyl-L-tyrosine phosphorylase/[glutamate--ammonia-ligase] adenylyltransferase [Pseudomonadota bacterium]